MNSRILDNHRERKTLASQLDRMDSILDGLSDGLNEAVAEAATRSMKAIVGVAVQEAVRATLVEVMANAEVQRRLAAQQQPAPSASPGGRMFRLAGACAATIAGAVKGVWGRLTAALRPRAQTARDKAVEILHDSANALRHAGTHAARHVRKGWLWLTVMSALAIRFRLELAIALGIGILVGAACYVGGREVAATGCAAVSFLGSLATRTTHRLREMVWRKQIAA